MSMPALLDVAIGLVLMYLILSLAVTTVGEIVSTILHLRAKHLSRTLSLLLDDKGVRERFYNHGLIVSSKTASRGGETEDGATTPADAAAKPKKTTDAAGIPKDKDHPSYFDSRVFAMALLDSVGDAEKDPTSGLPVSLNDVRNAVGKLKDGRLRDVLMANLAATQTDLAGLRDNVAAWFDTAMDRLTGDFARQSKTIALGIGVIFAVALNADSVEVTKALWKDKDMRERLVQTAAGVSSTEDLKPACPALENDGDQAKRWECLRTSAEKLQNGLRPFPIGWDPAAIKVFVTENPIEKIIAFVWPPYDMAKLETLGVVGLKIFGLLFTGFALSLGAPFWFDLLQKFMSIRSTGPKPKTNAQLTAP